jgi:hypothetical protein
MERRAEGLALEILNDVFYESTAFLGFMNSSVFYQFNLTLHPLFYVGTYFNVLYLTFKLHCKKRLTFFTFPAGMSLTKLCLAGNILISPGQGEFGKWHPGWGREYQ